MNEHEFNQRVAENLAKYRKLHGLTQAELAELISYFVNGNIVNMYIRSCGLNVYNRAVYKEMTAGEQNLFKLLE